jgi:hypothetical protein
MELTIVLALLLFKYQDAAIKRCEFLWHEQKTLNARMVSIQVCGTKTSPAEKSCSLLPSFSCALQ